jgi:hypothetical protein
MKLVIMGFSRVLPNYDIGNHEQIEDYLIPGH